MKQLALGFLALAVASPAAAQSDPHPTLTVGSITARRGEKVTGVIVVPAGSDSGYSIPVAIVHGRRPGPVLAIASGAHGTEYASIIAVERLIGELDPARIAGSVILLPLINVASFLQKVPHVNPVDYKSMNRFYPGSMTGSQTERASALITQQVVEQSDHLIDLHGGDLDENLRPYSYWTVTGNARQDSLSKGMVLAFGLDHIIISTDRPKDPAASRYLENTATTRGKPSITAEAGRAGRTDAADVGALVKGSLGVMAYLGMINRTVHFVRRPVWVEKVVTVSSDQTGIFYPLVERDAPVTVGQKLGYVTDYVGKTIFEARAPAAGRILYVGALPSMRKGETIANIGILRGGTP
ncbi:MAG: succinylglutamate desuccinylase/aspartoacylase family protein [Gemmatimonadota bacterium]|nr:succinylglutamate desuccinylase/aspartoacylase family protein [Gemmatimonadota bacterium]